MAHIFNGEQQAAHRAAQLIIQVQQLRELGKQVKVAALFFHEDAGSRVYSGLKQAAAQQAGIEYTLHAHSLQDSAAAIIGHIQQLNHDPAITGIIIQKPTRRSWLVAHPDETQLAFTSWWQSLTAQLNPDKDVDGLSPVTQTTIATGDWQTQGRVLPATVKAVLAIITAAEQFTGKTHPTTVIIGRSDLLGQPLYHVLRHTGYQVQLLGKAELAARLNSPQQLQDAEMIISATGQYHLITGEMIAPGAIVIDVGEPRPDVDLTSVSSRAAFVTPVPGGVGPLTVICLLENAVELCRQS